MLVSTGAENANVIMLQFPLLNIALYCFSEAA